MNSAHIEVVILIALFFAVLSLGVVFGKSIGRDKTPTQPTSPAYTIVIEADCYVSGDDGAEHELNA